MDQLTMQFVLIGGFMLLAYVFMIKPQKKRQKEIMEMRNNLKIGDSIITIGGIKGKIVKLTDTDVVIETSDGTKIEFIKSAIHSIVSKSEESSEEDDEEEEDSEEN